LQRVFENPPLLDSEERKHYIDIADGWNMESKLYELGVLQPSALEKTVTDSFALTNFQLGGKGDSLKVRLHSQDYFEITPSDKLEKVNYGQLIHEIFENIITAKDIDRALKRMLFEGKIEKTEMKQLRAEIAGKLEDDTVHSWFDGSWKVLAERDILRGKERTHRPDRVMMKDNQLVVVDYKTGMELEKNRRQVADYLADIREMGYPQTRGYVWYIQENKLVEVD
jgi:CRISPR/Cas system-associated exonuclease Cas4 (RecB family)